MLSTMELSDFGCFLIMSCGVALLQRTGIVILWSPDCIWCGSFFVLIKFNVLLLFYCSFPTLCLRYQLNISYDPWSRNNKIVCGLQCFRGEHNLLIWIIGNYYLYLCVAKFQSKWVFILLLAHSCEQDLVVRKSGNFSECGRREFFFIFVNHETIALNEIRCCSVWNY